MEDPANNSPDPSPRRRKKKRGGRRPGAGAPKGNLNALKHGRYSAQFSAIGAVMAADPKLQNTLLALAKRHGLKQTEAQEIGWEVLLRFLKHAGDIAAGRTKKPFLPDEFYAPDDFDDEDDFEDEGEDDIDGPDGFQSLP